MEFSQTRRRLFSFAVSAMFSSAFLATAPDAMIHAAAGPQPAALAQAFEGLRGAGFQGLPSAAPIPPAAAALTPVVFTPAPAFTGLNDTELKKLDGYLPQFGHDVELAKSVSDALGLTRGAATLTVRQLAIGDAPNPKHVYSRVPSGGFFYILANSAETRSYFVGADQLLVAAVTVPHGDTAASAIPITLAQTQIKDEIAFWAKTADQ